MDNVEAMSRKRATRPSRTRRREEVEQYVHGESKRLNNPPVGLVTAQTDVMNGKSKYELDPHLDPQLQWAGKKEGGTFEVEKVSLHVHERIDPLTIIKAIQRREYREQQSLFGYFEFDENNPPIREAIEFYKHAQGWSNRLIAGDSLLVINSLIEKESMAGKVQMIYIDPPYGIKYGSNFQPFVNNKDVQDGKDEDLTQEPEMVKAFRDTWELGIHSYLTYLRDRLLLSRELLHESGSCFVQISGENVHHVKEIMDEVFGVGNFSGLIPFVKTTGQTSKLIAPVTDYLLWYSKDHSKTKYHQLFVERAYDKESLSTGNYRWVELPAGTRRTLTTKELENPSSIPDKLRVFALSATSSQTRGKEAPRPYTFQGKEFRPEGSRGWSTSNPEGLDRLAAANRLYPLSNTLRYVRYFDDFPYFPLRGLWTDTGISGFASDKVYVVQTNTKVIERCVLMTTDPGDLVVDPTCGGGTTAFCAEKWGRRWITCDTSRVAIALSKERLMTATFDYFKLAVPSEGVASGFSYERIKRITLKSIATQSPPEEVTLYDRPVIDESRRRISGPFTVEAVPSQKVLSLEAEGGPKEPDTSIARSGSTSILNDWIDELLSSGIRGRNAQVLEFVRVEPLGGTEWIHAEAQTKDGKKVVISFGPEFSPLEQRQVELAIEEAQELVPKPRIVVFASFQFDPEAAKDIDELKWPGVDVLKVQMNTDLFTSDLKKNRSSNESFWLVGQPDVEIKREAGKYSVVVSGFDYYNTKAGTIESGDVSKIAMWELDPDYDGRSIYPRQVFFPMSGSGEGWSKLARTLRAVIDEELVKAYHGNTSLPFSLGENRQVAVKIIDDRGIESFRVLKVRD